MKKTRIWITAAALSLIMSAPAFAAQWKSNEQGWWWENEDGSYIVSAWQEISGKWYYFYENGYMAANTWVGNYYVGGDGAMLTNTTTPDGYRVDENGAWIPDETNSRPTAPYLALLSDPLFCGPCSDEFCFDIAGNNANTVDHGEYYELKNQHLENFKVYDTEKEAKQSTFYKHFGLGRVEKHPCGKYVIPTDNDRFETVTVYSGSLYMNKDVKVSYWTLDRQRNLVEMTCSWEEYFNLPQSVTNCYNGSIIGYVKQVDEKGYITWIHMTQAG